MDHEGVLQFRPFCVFRLLAEGLKSVRYSMHQARATCQIRKMTRWGSWDRSWYLLGFQAVNCQHNQPPIMFSQLAVVDCQIVSFSSLLGKKKVYGISLNGQVQRGHLNIFKRWFRHNRYQFVSIAAIWQYKILTPCMILSFLLPQACNCPKSWNQTTKQMLGA